MLGHDLKTLNFPSEDFLIKFERYSLDLTKGPQVDNSASDSKRK